MMQKLLLKVSKMMQLTTMCLKLYNNGKLTDGEGRYGITQKIL